MDHSWVIRTLLSKLVFYSIFYSVFYSKKRIFKSFVLLTDIEFTNRTLLNKGDYKQGNVKARKGESYIVLFVKALQT